MGVISSEVELCPKLGTKKGLSMNPIEAEAVALPSKDASDQARNEPTPLQFVVASW